MKGGSFPGSGTHSSLFSGALDGGFRFDLSDGEHVSSGHFFRVMAQKQAQLSLEGTRTLTVCPGGPGHQGRAAGTCGGHAVSRGLRAVVAAHGPRASS